MTKEEIIQIAKKCGWDNPATNMMPLYEFATLVASAERDRMCEQFNLSKELAHEKAKSNEAN